MFDTRDKIPNEYYIDMKAWKTNKETCLREKDRRDLELLERMRY